MSRYPLSARAAQVERRWEKERAQKDILPWKGGAASTENGDNFRTNQVTVADAADVMARTARNAVGLSATWACVNLLAGTIASLPLVVYRTDRAGVRTVAKDHPLYRVLHDSANFDQTSTDFWEYQTAAIELQGNAYATIDKRQNGDIVSLTPIRPDCVSARRLTNGRIEYQWTERGTRTVRQSVDVLHIRGPLGDALSGASVLSVCRSAFDTALHADGAASTVFQNGARPSGVLSTDKPMKPEQRAEAQQLLTEKFIGAVNAGRPMLLDNGLTWTSIAMSPEDVQMLDTRKFSVEEICRIFGIPPHMIGHTSTSTSWGTGLEQQTLGFVKFSLRRRLKRIEQSLEKQLLTARDRAEGVSIEFNLEGLLRGDSASRAAFYQSGLANGWRTINEVRALENLPPVPGGDVPRMQMQNVPITEAGQENGDAA